MARKPDGYQPEGPIVPPTSTPDVGTTAVVPTAAPDAEKVASGKVAANVRSLAERLESREWMATGGFFGPTNCEVRAERAPAINVGTVASGHRLLSSGDCSCGWKAGSMLSYDQALKAWEVHSKVAEMLEPGAEVGSAGAPTPKADAKDGTDEGSCRQQSVADSSPAPDAGKSEGNSQESEGNSAAGELDSSRVHSGYVRGPRSGHWICVCGADLGPCHVNEIEKVFADHQEFAALAHAAFKAPPQPWPPAPVSISFGEGKKIYDQGWNDGIDHLRKMLMLSIEQRLRR